MLTNTKVQNRCYDNCRRWWNQQYGGGQHGSLLEPYTYKDDRTYFGLNQPVREVIEGLARLGIIEHRNQSGLRRLHGPTAYVTYRETVSRYGAQLTLHTSNETVPPLLEIDFDYWNPWDLVGLVGHASEVMVNRLRNKKTDPFKVAKARGWL